MKGRIRLIIAITYLSRLWFLMYAEFNQQFWIYLYYLFNWLIIAGLIFLAVFILNTPIRLTKQEIFLLTGELRRCGIFFATLFLCEIFYIIIGEDLSSHPAIVFGQFAFILYLISLDVISRVKAR